MLGVGRDAGEAEVKKAFRRVARELHPDANPDDPHAEEKFKEAAEAYEVLSDADRRRQYDAYGHEGLRAGGGAELRGLRLGLGPVLRLLRLRRLRRCLRLRPRARAAAGRSRARTSSSRSRSTSSTRRAAGRSRSPTTSRSAASTASGNGAEPGTPIVTCPRCHGSGQLQAVSRTAFGQLVRTAVCDVCGGDGRVPEQPCSVCDGAGTRRASTRTVAVPVPVGIADGQRVRVAGRGHAGERGGPNGDLLVVVRVREDERFIRDGEDLHTVVDVAAPLAALGTTVEVPGIEGGIALEIPAGTQPGEVITMRARGMPAGQRTRTGDLHVHVNVVIPRRLSREQRDLLHQLADSLTDRNLAEDEGMLAKLKRTLSR